VGARLSAQVRAVSTPPCLPGPIGLTSGVTRNRFEPWGKRAHSQWPFMTLHPGGLPGSRQATTRLVLASVALLVLAAWIVVPAGRAAPASAGTATPGSAAARHPRPHKIKCPTPVRRRGHHVRPRKGFHPSPRLCPANHTPSILPVLHERPMRPHDSSGGPFPPSLVHSFGPEGDVIGTPPLPVGRFIRAPHRRVPATPALQEAGPSEGQAPPSAHGAAGLPLAVVRNISLKSGPAFAMPVAPTLTPADGSEQSVATNGRGLVLYTTNTKDAFSVNGGRSFFPLDPSTVFPSAAGGFCCDQVVTYVPSIDRFVWVLQYQDGNGGVQDSTQPNVIRVATATSASFMSCNARCWSYYDWTPADLGARSPAAGKTVTLDRPHVAFSHGMLSLAAAIGYNP
jgi:hypothetical protein